jgi:hypothetical protein
MTTETPSKNQLDDAVRRFIARWRAARNVEPAIAEIEAMTAPAFRVLVAERLRAVERDVAEVRARVNGLLFVVAGAVVTQLVLRLVA